MQELPSVKNIVVHGQPYFIVESEGRRDEDVKHSKSGIIKLGAIKEIIERVS